MRTSIHIPDDLLARAKRKAAKEGRTLTSLIEEGLRMVLEPSAKRRNDERRARLPVSSVADGVLANVDLTSNASLQEIEDEQVIRDAGLVKLR